MPLCSRVVWRSRPGIGGPDCQLLLLNAEAAVQLAQLHTVQQNYVRRVYDMFEGTKSSLSIQSFLRPDVSYYWDLTDFEGV
jgi:hypothetical protein